jgi:beta-glucuronidase
MHTLPVPGCWEQYPDFLTIGVKSAFSNKLYIRQAAEALRLEFKGVSHTIVSYM